VSARTSAPFTPITECAWRWAGSYNASSQGSLSVDAEASATRATTDTGWVTQHLVVIFARTPRCHTFSRRRRTGPARYDDDNPECYAAILDAQHAPIAVFGNAASINSSQSFPASGNASGVLPAGYYYLMIHCDANAGNGDIPASQASAIPYCRFMPGQPVGPFAAASGGAAASSDDDGDGLTAIQEYGLVLPLNQPSLPPAATLFQYAEGERLRMFLTRDPARHDVTLTVRAAPSPDGPWTDVAESRLGQPFTGAGYVSGDADTPGLKTVEVRDIVNRDAALARFMKVDVTY
jgi:hypothetical protein